MLDGRLTDLKAQKHCSCRFRRIEVFDKEKGETIVLLTNYLEFGATTISATYKDRWQIEIFFKILKQNLRVKTFVGTTANALKIQIWIALIAILLLKYLKIRSRYHWSLSNLVALLRLNLFSYRDLWEWIDNPTEPPPVVLEQELMELSFCLVGQHMTRKKREPQLEFGKILSHMPVKEWIFL